MDHMNMRLCHGFIVSLHVAIYVLYTFAVTVKN